MKQRSTRKPRAYKIDDVYYKAAQEKASKTDKPLAVRVEEYVKTYSGVTKSDYCAAVGGFLIKESNKKKK